MFLYPLAKAGHWETEKAGYKNADESVYKVRVTRPALVLSRKCFISIEVMFSVALQLNCGQSQKNSAVVNFKEFTRAFFIAPVQKRGNLKNIYTL